RAQRLEDARGDARAVAHADHGDLRDVRLLRDAAHALAIFHRDVGDDHRTDALTKARSDVYGHAVQLGDLHSARVHDACADRRELGHLVVLDVAQFAGRLPDARVCAADAGAGGL